MHFMNFNYLNVRLCTFNASTNFLENKVYFGQIFL